MEWVLQTSMETPVNLAFGKPRQEDWHKWEMTLGYKVSSRPAGTMETLCQKQK